MVAQKCINNVSQNFDDKSTEDLLKSLTKPKKFYTLRDEQYIALAENAARETRRLCSDMSQWTRYSSYSDGTELFERKSTVPYTSESMFLLVTTLPASLEALEHLLTPEFRREWDTLVADAEIVSEWPAEEVYLVRELFAPIYMVAAREALDIVKVVRSVEGEVTIGATSVVHENFVPCKDHVRLHHFLGGWVMQRVDKSSSGTTLNPTPKTKTTANGSPQSLQQTRLYVLFHVDLNLSGPRFFARKQKPKLMLQNLENLRKAIAAMN